MVLVALSASLLGCRAAGAPSPAAGPVGNPTATETPSGDVLRVDGRPVVQVLIPDASQGPVYLLTKQGLFARNGGMWVSTGTAHDGRRFLAHPANPERLFRGDHPTCAPLQGDAATIPFEISEDGGRTWTTIAAGKNIRPLAIDPNLPDTVYGSDCGLTMSVDGGRTWRRLQLMVGYEVTALSFVGQQMLALGISPEGTSRLRRIDLNDPLIPVPRETLLELSGYASMDARDNRLVVGGRHSVYVSDDGGATWTSSREGLEAVTDPQDAPPTTTAADMTPADSAFGVLAVAVDPGNKQRIFAGTVRGLFVSQDGGVSWDRYDAVPARARVTAIQFARDSADLYVTTDAGVIETPNPTS